MVANNVSSSICKGSRTSPPLPPRSLNCARSSQTGLPLSMEMVVEAFSDRFQDARDGQQVLEAGALDAAR